MTPLNAIIVDDNYNSLQNLQQKLSEFCPDIKVQATTQSAGEASVVVREREPEVVFLQSEEPGMHGFRVLDARDE